MPTDTHCRDEDMVKRVAIAISGAPFPSARSMEKARAAIQISIAENFGLLSLLYDIRIAAGDKDGRLMQDELVAHIASLRADAERYRFLRDVPEGSPHEQIGNYPGDMWDAAIDAARGAE
jgi:hypothetical protein